MYVTGQPDCFVFKPQQTAECQHFNATSGTQRITSTASWYPPTYYAFAGLPSLLSDSPNILYVMRLWSALACAFFLACGLWMLRFVEGPRFLHVGVAAAATPMVMFLSGVVNPNSLEVAAAFVVWVGGVVIFSSTVPLATSVVVMTTAGASVMILMRTLSWFWFGIIVVVLAVAYGLRGIHKFLRIRKGRISVAIVTASLLAQFAWLFKFHLFSVQDPGTAIHAPSALILRGAAGDIHRLWQEMIGVFGWLDTPSPTLTYILWLLAVGFVVGTAVIFTSRRANLALALLAGAVLLGPIALEFYEAPHAGYVWQGRYTLPIAIGIPVIAALSSRLRIHGPRQARRRYGAVLATILAVAHVGAFYWALRRYTVGIHGSPLPTRHASWAPPGGTILVLVAYCVCVGFFAWLLLTDSRFGIVPAWESSHASARVDVRDDGEQVPASLSPTSASRVDRQHSRVSLSSYASGSRKQ
jgi:hypothetical protein